MNQVPPTLQTESSPSTNNPQPSKKKKGCLIAIGVVIALAILGAIAGSDDDEKPDKEAKTNTETSVENSATKESAKVDSVKIKELTPKFTENFDEFKSVTWVKPKSAPKYLSMTGYYTYFDLNENRQPENLRFVIQYMQNNDWLFIRKYVFLIDGKTYEFNNPDMERDNDTRTWEWSDTGVTQDHEAKAIVRAIRNAKEVKVRFIGDTYHNDKTLTQEQIKSITEPIDYFEALGGKF